MDDSSDSSSDISAHGPADYKLTEEEKLIKRQDKIALFSSYGTTPLDNDQPHIFIPNPRNFFKRFKCEACGVLSNNNWVITTHIQQRHFNHGKTNNKCPKQKCGKVFELFKDALVHFYNKHIIEYYVCKICHNKYKFIGDMHLHLTEHN